MKETKKHDQFFNQKQVNFLIFFLLATASILYIIAVVIATNLNFEEKVVSIIILVAYPCSMLLLNYIKFFEDKLKYLYPVSCSLALIITLYIEKGTIDILFIFFPLIALSVLYFQNEVLIFATASITLINIVAFFWNKPALYPTLDQGQFLSIIISMIAFGAFLSYIIKKVYSIVEKAKEEENNAKLAFNSLERTLIQLDKAYMKLKDTQTQLVQQEKMASLGMLVAGVAHEINNPLGAINCNVNLYKTVISKFKMTQAVNEDSHALKLLSTLEDANKTNLIACDRILDIVKSLRNFARLDEAEFKEADIHTGIDCTLILLNNKIKNKIEVVKNYSYIPMFTCYPNQLNQVFMNLLSNAIDAINESNVNGTIWISTYSDHNFVYVKIKDSGMGISHENLERIFDPGFTTKGVGVGTGLGLSIVFKIIEKHKGKIEVESEIAKGTEFKITIPLKLQ